MSLNSSAARITGDRAVGGCPDLSSLLALFRLAKYSFITTEAAKSFLNSPGRLLGILKMVSPPGSMSFSRSTVDFREQKVLKVIEVEGRTKLEILFRTGA